MIKNEDGTYTMGPLDAVLILRHRYTGRFHYAIFEEAPMPGPVPAVDDVKMVRLRSKAHHTDGAATLDEAKQQIATMRTTIKIDDASVDLDPITWNGGLPIMLFAHNWLSFGIPVTQAMTTSTV